MINVRTEQVIDVGDWDNLVTETYGRPYNLQQQGGCMERQSIKLTVPNDAYDYENDTVPETVNHDDMGVSFAAWLARDPAQKLNAEKWDSPSSITLWWDRNFYPDIQMVANDLHAKGLLPAGKYVIYIDW
jgi:hypothetical protein